MGALTLSTAELAAAPSSFSPEVPTLDPLTAKIQSAAAILQKMDRTQPHLAEETPELKTLHRLLKQAKKQSLTNPTVEKCHKEFLAFKLGVPAAALDEKINPGFEKFAKEAHLERYLIIYKHHLEVDPKTHEVRIQYQGALQPWSDVREIALTNLDKPLEFKSELPKLYNPPFPYGQEGVQNKNCYNWTELTPFLKDPKHTWGNRYLFEICALCTGKLRFFGDHTWVRLKTPDGHVYSAGVYREDNDVSTGFTIKRAKIQSPDISEFWPEKIHTVSFEISEAAFRAIKADIERMHKREDLDFHVLNKNCTRQATQWAKVGGINLSAKTSFVYSFIPGRLYHTAISIHKKLPKPIQWIAKGCWSIIHFVISILFNAAQAILGGTRISTFFSAEKRKELRAHIRSPLDLFRVSKVEMESPYVVSHILPEEVERARREEEKKRSEAVDQLRYWTPPQFAVQGG